MRKGISVVLILVITGISFAGAEVFRFKYNEGEKYKINSLVNENVYTNGILNNRAQLLYKIAVQVKNATANSGLIEATFLISHRASDNHSIYQWDEEYSSVSRRDEYGRYTIDPKYYMPVVRNVPTFPEGDIKPGSTWSLPGEEVQDFKEFGINLPFRIPIEVEYRYIGKTEKDGQELDLISMKYRVAYKPGGIDRNAAMYPIRVSGSSDQLLYWDNEKGKYYAFEEKFDFIYYFNTGDIIEYEGDGTAKLIESSLMNKDELVDRIKKELSEKGVEDTEVRKEEKGVTISLEDIKFLPDSDILLDSEKRKLERIAEILKTIPDRDLVITGHTALAGTEEGRQQLSIERAGAVGDYLLQLGVRLPEHMLIRGMGAGQPIGDNRTEEGRRKNRRVEITILEN
ncbi:MAG: OmpA family protein [Spirochaetota bacterium]